MESIIKFLDDLITRGVISGTWITIILGIAGLGILFYYVTKGIILLFSHYKSHSDITNTEISKEELISMKISLLEDNKYILKLLDEVNDKLKTIESNGENAVELNKQLEGEISRVSKQIGDIEDSQEDEAKYYISIQRDLSVLVCDSKTQYAELVRQIQAVQKDLASLHGTIIGMNTQRARLK
jgi:predicted nuclease with TOPRIM domain